MLARIGLGLLIIAGLSQCMFGIASLVLLAGDLSTGALAVISSLLVGIVLTFVLVRSSTRRQEQL